MQAKCAKPLSKNAEVQKNLSYLILGSLLEKKTLAVVCSMLLVNSKFWRMINIGQSSYKLLFSGLA